AFRADGAGAVRPVRRGRRRRLRAADRARAPHRRGLRDPAGAGAVRRGAARRGLRRLRPAEGPRGGGRVRPVHPVLARGGQPGGGCAGSDRPRDVVAEDGFVPFTRFWRGELSPAAHQVWLTTRFHHHLVAALHGARGIAPTAKTGYYDVKHGSLVEGGSRWRV